jgi:RNA polymerase sigma factor (sigma-70 family)
MPINVLDEFLHHLRGSALLREGAEPTDGQLLEAFVRRGDRQALEDLVRRHAPIVWGVCRRVLAKHHDAEDAFQTTFLVLVKKAASIRSPELLANWLYRVAYQTAVKARQVAAKRCAREKQMVGIPEPKTESSDAEFGPEEQALLHEELRRLLDKYRIAVVVCDLEGRSRAEAAQQLGLPEGTVASRLAQGRVLLAERLRLCLPVVPRRARHRRVAVGRRCSKPGDFGGTTNGAKACRRRVGTCPRWRPAHRASQLG